MCPGLGRGWPPLHTPAVVVHPSTLGRALVNQGPSRPQLWQWLTWPCVLRPDGCPSRAARRPGGSSAAHGRHFPLTQPLPCAGRRRGRSPRAQQAHARRGPQRRVAHGTCPVPETCRVRAGASLSVTPGKSQGAWAANRGGTVAPGPGAAAQQCRDRSTDTSHAGLRSTWQVRDQQPDRGCPLQSLLQGGGHSGGEGPAGVGATSRGVPAMAALNPGRGAQVCGGAPPSGVHATRSQRAGTSPGALWGECPRLQGAGHWCQPC